MPDTTTTEQLCYGCNKPYTEYENMFLCLTLKTDESKAGNGEYFHEDCLKTWNKALVSYSQTKEQKPPDVFLFDANRLTSEQLLDFDRMAGGDNG